MKYLFIALVLISTLWAEKTVIGKFERVSFNEFGLKNLRAKIDTGAKTSSLHCNFIKEIEGKKVSFILLDSEHEKYKPLIHVAKISRIAKVKSSNASVQKRYFIKTKITVLGQEYETEFSLTDRGDMTFPVLIDRSLLKKGFLVDVTRKYTR